MNMKYGNHSVYRLEYHIVLVVKYRRPCIIPEIGDFLVSESRRLLEMWESELIEGNYDKDHIHLLVSMSPKYAPMNFIASLKNTLARNVRKKYGEYLKQYLWGGAFWSASYYIASTGGASLDTIQKYIQQQGKPKKERKKRNNSSPAQS